MALEHKENPLYGVQFHPESVCSEYGATIIANFHNAALQFHQKRGNYATQLGSDEEQDNSFSDHLHHHHASQPQFAMPATEALRWKIKHEILSHTEASTDRPSYQWVDPEAVCVSAAGSNKNMVWLDSSLIEKGRSRFSFICLPDQAGLHAFHLTYSVATNTLERRWLNRCEPDGGIVERIHIPMAGGIFNWLTQFMRDNKADTEPGQLKLPFEFTGGLVGYIGYELKAASLPRHASDPLTLSGNISPRQQQQQQRPTINGNVSADATTTSTSSSSSASLDAAADSNGALPDLSLFFCDRFIAFDHETEQVYLVCLTAIDQAKDDADLIAAETWFTEMRQWLQSVADSPLPPLTPSREERELSFTLQRDDAQYRQGIQGCLQNIADGESYELCLTNKLLIPEARRQDLPDALAWYRMLRSVNPAPFAAFIYLENTVAVLCSSPEKFVSVSSEGTITTKPIKGTRPRGATPDEDELLRESLRTSKKDLAENLMITDLSRNDLGRVCAKGTVSVPSLMSTIPCPSTICV
jgi:para-aminobenzoate synthetase